MKQNRFLNFVKRPWFVITVLLLAGIVYAAFIPWNLSVLTSHPNPAQNYEEAVRRIDGMKAERASLMNADCQTQLMTHGQKAQKVIVLVHGYTNCPVEFIRLGTGFYNLGYNVLIAPLPHHGLIDRVNTEQGLLSAEELAAYGDNVVDIAQGLGEQVTVMGLSCGGIVTSWVAQNRSDVDLAVVISPAFGFLEIPTALTAPVTNAIIKMPDQFVWWYPDKKEKCCEYYNYPQYSKHALAQIMRLGFSVQVNSRKTPASARRIIVVTNAHDDSVNNALTYRVTEYWRQEGAQLSTYEFPDNLGLPHDLIDINKPAANIELVYQKLIELVEQ